jgi:hypothetical protein
MAKNYKKSGMAHGHPTFYKGVSIYFAFTYSADLIPA